MTQIDRKTQAVVQHLREQKQLLATGLDALNTVAKALAEARARLGIEVSYAPDTPPEFVDYLGVGAVGALHGAAAGAAAGMLTGLAFREPVKGLGIGFLLGGLLGALAGLDRVRTGWRVRAGWLEDGRPCVTIREV